MSLGHWHISAAKALGLVPTSEGKRFATVLEHGTLTAEIYAPRGEDPQKPHTRDEIYVVLAGRGEFVLREERRAFVSGDVLFAPAGVPHRFEAFSNDFATWGFFYGPEGGEVEVPGTEHPRPSGAAGEKMPGE
jgi:mannose-6-phosphate isomerase-like protein (cupin superfamily)